MQLPDVLENLLYEELADCISEGLLSAINSDDITWITVKGNHIPILEGQSKSQAIKSFFKNKQKEPPTDGIVDDVGKAVKDLIEYATCETKEPAYQYPKTIAGVTRGNPMPFSLADSGNSNPYYSSNNYVYSHNCQSCVVSYEARRRGYNVQAAPRGRKDKTAQLAHHASWAWIDPKTNKKCEFTTINAKDEIELHKWLNQNVKQGQRYQFAYNWYKKDDNTWHGHTVVIEKDLNNNLLVFDPQTGKKRSGKILYTYFQRTKKPRILRIDDKKFNPYFMNDVLRK